MFKFLIVLCLVGMPLDVLAQEPNLVEKPKAIVEWPLKAVEGDKIILDASKSTGKDFTWQVIAPDSGLTDSELFEPIENGKKCVLASKPATYYLFLSVSNEAGISSSPHVLIITAKGDKPPTPTPNSFKLLVTDAINKVTSTTKVEDAKEIAKSYRTVAAQIKGTKLNAEQITELLRAANRANIKQSTRDLWGSWSTTLAKRLGELNEEGKLVTADEHAAIYTEIAEVLEGVK